MRIAAELSGIVVDGVIEPAWYVAQELRLGFELEPNPGLPADEDTRCRVGFDSARLYIACTASDSDPASIRSYFSRWDDLDGQDYVGVSVDPVGDARRAFHFSVSPSGVQSDGIYDAATGSIDDTWDGLWNAVARRTDTGYVVEASIPFATLRFRQIDGPAQPWRIYFFRVRPRSTGVSYQSFAWDPSQSCLLCQAHPLRPPVPELSTRALEVVPTIVVEHATGGPDISERAGNVDLGLTTRVGLTTDLSLTATLNPDFSQIELDSVQIRANTRFALFVPEKRPFFLEGADLFETPFQMLFTRAMADPDVGVKLSGKAGRNAVGVLAVRDAVTNLLIPGPEGSTTVSRATPNQSIAARWRRDFEGGQSIGGLFTGRVGQGYYNHAAAADAFVRVAGGLDTRLQVLASRTLDPEWVPDRDLDPRTGLGAKATWRFNNRAWATQGSVTHQSEGVRTDLGFEPRSGYSEILGSVRREWWGADDDRWVRADVTAGVWVARTTTAGLAQRQFFGRIAVDGPGQTRFYFNPRHHRESFAGRDFTVPQIWWWFWARPSGRFDFHARIAHGSAVDYMEVRRSGFLEALGTLSVRLGRGLRVDAQGARRTLRHEGLNTLDARVLQSRVAFHPTNRLRIRVIFQRSSSVRRQSAGQDVPPTMTRWVEGVASYLLNPRTGLYVGYGGEAVERDPSVVSDAPGPRRFFVKLGYAWSPFAG